VEGRGHAGPAGGPVGVSALRFLELLIHSLLESVNLLVEACEALGNKLYASLELLRDDVEVALDLGDFG
jgi:hypothetical protein